MKLCNSEKRLTTTAINKNNYMEVKIFVRHCNFSRNSANKTRPSWFSKEGCFKNLLDTKESCDLTVMFDGKPNENHFLYNEKSVHIVCKDGFNDAASFMNLIEYVYSLDMADNTILYFLEDDYLHRPGWVKVLKEAFEKIDVDYVTLYDHPDKYDSEGYSDLQSRLVITDSVHWRTTPSTTNTYAVKNSTFRKHYSIHREFCNLTRGHTHDHEKFLKLWEIGSNLISCIPGYSTHCEYGIMSPTVDWEKYAQS